VQAGDGIGRSGQKHIPRSSAGPAINRALFHQAVLKLDDRLRTVLVPQLRPLFDDQLWRAGQRLECTFYQQGPGAGAEAADRVPLSGVDFFNKLEYRSGNGGHGRQEEG